MAHNDYDRIFRENIKAIFVHYVEGLLGLEIANSKALPGKITGTYENEVDHLALATSRSGEQFLLHFEFQTQNDPNMLKRMGHYHGVLYREYGLPIHHFVIYLGQRKATMRTTLDDDEIFKGFHLIELASLKLEDFLSAPNPEKVLLGILSDFGSKTAPESIELIVAALQVTSENEIQLKRYLRQLKILAGIRKLGNVVHEIIKKMPLQLSVRDTYDFKLGFDEGNEKGMEKGREEGREEGREQGREEGREKTVVNLVISGKISIETAAEELEITVAEMKGHIARAQKNSGLTS